MRQYISDAYHSTWQFLNGLDRSGWLIVMAVVMLLGFLCMRGFGSRSKY